MRKFFQKKSLRLLGFLLIIINAACLDTQIEDHETEAQAKLEKYLQENNYTDAEHIGYGVYVRVEDGTDVLYALSLGGMLWRRELA